MSTLALAEKNPNWMGGKYVIGSVHQWIAKNLGKPNYCEICKRTDKKDYDWSNKDHKYRRDLNDWQRLCRSCHTAFDIKHNNRKFPSTGMLGRKHSRKTKEKITASNLERWSKIRNKKYKKLYGKN